jgi:hypothetical protein
VTWVGTATALIRKRLDLVDRVFPGPDTVGPIEPRPGGGFSEPQTPSCGRYGLGHMPNEAECVYCIDLEAE